MDSKKKITISWSGGKDSAFALYKLMSSDAYEVVHLHTVIGEDTRRVGLHGVHESLIERQAEAIGIPLIKLYLRESDHHGEYENLMNNFYDSCQSQGIQYVMFGDIFLEDLKEFRDARLRAKKMEGIYPIWMRGSADLLNEFFDAGFKTVICAANAELFASEDLGRTLSREVVARFHSHVDPCGENGEFHTFVYDGPIFRKPVAFTLGKNIEKSYKYNVRDSSGTITEQTSKFLFCDLMTKD